MPAVSRLSGTPTTPEGFRVVTESGGSTYEYELRRVAPDDAPGDDEQDTEENRKAVEVVSKTVDGEEVAPEATGAVRDVMNERGIQVAE